MSAVAFPAYEGTTLEAASEDNTLESVRASLDSAKEALAAKRAEETERENRTVALERLNNLIKEVKSNV